MMLVVKRDRTLEPFSVGSMHLTVLPKLRTFGHRYQSCTQIILYGEMKHPLIYHFVSERFHIRLHNAGSSCQLWGDTRHFADHVWGTIEQNPSSHFD